MNNLVLGNCILKLIDYRGKTPFKLGGEWKETGIRVISAKNVHGGFLTDLDDIRCVDDSIYNLWMKEPILNGDIFICSEGATLGESLLWDSDEKIVLGQRLFAIRTNNNLLYNKYLAYYLQTEIFKKDIESKSTGSTVFGLSQPLLMGLEIPAPSIDEQIKIGDFYFDVLKKVKNNHRQIELISKEIQNLYSYIFEGNHIEVLDDGFEKELVYDQKLKREVNRKFETVNILSLVDWVSNSQPPKKDFIYEKRNGYVRFIQNRDFDSDKYITYVPNKKSLTTVCETDILIDKYGDAGRVRFGLSGAFNVALALIKPKRENLREFIRSFLSSQSIYEYLHNSCMASTRASLSSDNLSFLFVSLPPDELLTKYNDLISPMINQIVNLKKSNKTLINMIDFICPLLMSEQLTMK